MTAFKCEEMMYDHYISRIDMALNGAKLDHKVDLDAKTMAIEGCESCAAKAAEILDDLSFAPAAM